MRMRGETTILPLRITGLTYEADGKRLLGPLSLAIAAGRALALIGPNGAGKSLFLRLCHGLLRPSAGNVSWQAAGGLVAGSKRHAMVFQKPVMLRRSARANLIHACHAAGLSNTESKARVEAALTRFGLADLAERPARLLSGGEQQRLAIARASALRPEVLFLDEPTSQLDPGATRQIEEMLLVLKADGVTLVLATHDLPQARRLADDVAFFNRGSVSAPVAVADFFHSPPDAAAQAFISGDLLW